MSGLFDRKKRAKSAQLTVRLDEQLKKQVDQKLQVMGMSATDAVEQLYRFIAEHGRMPVQTRVVTSDALYEINFAAGKTISFSPQNVRSENREDNILRVAQEPIAKARPEQNNVYGDVSGFVRSFLSFLSARGISCSDPLGFEKAASKFAAEEGIHRTVMMTMQKRGGWYGEFVLHNETLEELPGFASTFPRELIANFDFLPEQATAVLQQIRPARDGQPQ